MKLKKIPKYLALTLLTAGASLILGFLSFGGMFAIWPVLSIAFGAFALAVAYEGEIYIQNIKGALNKLFKHNHLKNLLAQNYLLENFPDTAAEDCPVFFVDYKIQLELLHQFGHKKLDDDNQKIKNQLELTLVDMEKWFATQLFNEENDGIETNPRLLRYKKTLQAWLQINKQNEWKERYNSRQDTFKRVKIFSALAGFFMGIGSTYLLMEAFAVIPMFSAIAVTSLPFMIVPMAIIAGTAYGLLTYNAITDMINNDTLRTWYNKIKKDLSEDFGIRSVFIASSAIVLVLLATALTICTAGTWWTVAKEAQPLFTWMSKMPRFIMGIINPIITGLSAIAFNLQNTSESLEIIDNAARTKGNFIYRMGTAIREGFQSLRGHENWLQMLNPFRLLLKLTFLPLRILLFLGHLVAIGVTTDRVPGISQFLSALLGIVCEGLEDMHYFVPHAHHHVHEKATCEHEHEGHHHHEHEHKHEDKHFEVMLKERLGRKHGHSHDLDLPTRILRGIFSPIFGLAALWDSCTSQFNADTKKPTLNLKNAWKKQHAIPEDEPVDISSNAPKPSKDWQLEQAIFCIERHKEKHLSNAKIGQVIALEKNAALTALQREIGALNPGEMDSVAMKARLTEEKHVPLYNIHRFFDNGPTETASFLEALPQRIMLTAV